MLVEELLHIVLQSSANHIQHVLLECREVPIKFGVNNGGIYPFVGVKCKLHHLLIVFLYHNSVPSFCLPKPLILFTKTSHFVYQLLLFCLLRGL